MSFALAIASASSSKGIKQATGPKISSCAMRMRLSTSAKTVGMTKLPFLRSPVSAGASTPPQSSVAPSAGPSSM